MGINSRNQRRCEQAISHVLSITILVNIIVADRCGPHLRRFCHPRFPTQRASKQQPSRRCWYGSDPRLRPTARFPCWCGEALQELTQDSSGSTSCSPQVPPVLGTAPQRPRGRQSECKQGTPTTGIRRGRRSRCRRSCGCCFLVDVRLQPRDLGLNACLAMSSLLVRPWSNVDSFNTTTLTCPLCRVALH